MKRENSRSQQILNSLVEDIRCGRYAVQSAFPSETALARRFKVSRSLMTLVFGELEHQGLIVRRQGKGTFLAKRAASRKIGLIIPGVAVSDFFQPILGEISRLARAHAYELNFGEVDYSPSHDVRVRQVRELAAEFIRQRVAGVIYEPLVGDHAEEINSHILRVFDRKGIPVVLLDSDIVPFPARSAYDVIGTNDVRAGALIAEHLLAQGARAIHFHLPPNGPVTFDNRIFGAKAWLLAHGPKTKFAVLRSATDDGAALKRHLKAQGRPDAFVCMNDATAAAFRRTLEAAGLQVPRDVLLTGFADLSIASLMTPPLTTVRQDRAEIARATFRRLLARIAEPSLPPCSLFLPSPLVARGSTAKRR